jgi:hypothetical protein
MSEYKRPIKMRQDDPVCSATALGNTIIGILFDKKGSDIRKAIAGRTVLIEKKVSEYDSIIFKIDGFIKEKRKILKDLDEYYQDRADKKEAIFKPYRKELDVINKECYDRTTLVLKDMNDTGFSFDKDTYNEIGKKAVVFEESFETFKDTFIEIDEVKAVSQGAEGIQGVIGYQGIQGLTGCQGIKGFNDNVSSYSTYTTAGDVLAPKQVNLLSTKEDEAVARLGSLRNILLKYNQKANIIRDAIHTLNEEKRRLKVISDNINPEREYKLDLNKLSAFGFEDIEV